MKTVDLFRHLATMEARWDALAAEGKLPSVESCRNDGARRTPNKRRLLANAEARAKAAGIEPVPSRY
jgi:hypothetical protein